MEQTGSSKLNRLVCTVPKSAEKCLEERKRGNGRKRKKKRKGKKEKKIF